MKCFVYEKKFIRLLKENPNCINWLIFVCISEDSKRSLDAECMYK